MGRFFGTDGIRGRAGEAPLDAATVQTIGRAIVRALGIPAPRVLIGRDTRESGPAHRAAPGRRPGRGGRPPGIGGHHPDARHRAPRARSARARAGRATTSASSSPRPTTRTRTTASRSSAGPAASSAPISRTRRRRSSRSWRASRCTRRAASSSASWHGLPRPPEALVRRAVPERDAPRVDCANGATSFLARAALRGAGRARDRHPRPARRPQHQRGCGATHPETVAAEGEGGRGGPRPGLRRRRRPLHPGRLHRTRGGRRPRALPDRAPPAGAGARSRAGRWWPRS